MSRIEYENLLQEYESEPNVSYLYKDIMYIHCSVTS